MISLLLGSWCGWVNGFLTVTLGLPSFITTLGTGFILLDGSLHLARRAQEHPRPAQSIGKFFGHWIGGTRGPRSSGRSSSSRSSTSC
jgi:ribose/xylose/arabinose/galactoside ABC-type transport system permease subunit